MILKEEKVYKMHQAIDFLLAHRLKLTEKDRNYLKKIRRDDLLQKRHAILDTIIVREDRRKGKCLDRRRG